MSDKIREFIEVPQQFIRDGNQVLLSLKSLTPLLIDIQFLTRCTKPSQKGLLLPLCTVDVSLKVFPEFSQICKAVVVGFAVMGFIGYFVKLIHIPMCVTPISRLGIFDSNLIHYRNNILVYVIYIHYSQSLIFFQRRGIVYISFYIFLALGTSTFTAVTMWAFSAKLRKCEHQIILISTEINNMLTISVAYEQHAKSRTRLG